MSNINSCSQCCNVFNSSGNNPSAGGLAHWPVSGGAIFDGTSIKMFTQFDGPSNINTGTAYAIAYSFKIGFNYTMTIDLGYTANPTTAFPKLTLSTRVTLPSPTNSDPTPCGAVPSNKYLSSIGDVAQIVLPTQSAVKTYNVPQFSVNAQKGFLVLTVSEGGVVGTTAIINKITITETTSAPAASFSIGSSITSMVCGSTAPVTFTINNNANTSGITGYAWNVGATPNGWLYNGSPAPATIPITSATLTTLSLTPDCGQSLKSVSASVTANGQSYNTSNSAGISITQPTYSISGSASTCTSPATYTLNGLVCASTIAWTAPPSNLGTLSTLTSSPTTFNYGGTGGNLTLTANVTSCGVTTPVTLPIKVGPYSSSDYTMTASGNSTQPLNWCPNQTYGSSVNGATGTGYAWTAPTGWTQGPGAPPQYVKNYRAPSSTSPPTGTASVTFTEPCGTSITKIFFVAYQGSACTTPDPRFVFSPNPAPTTLYVAVASAYQTTTKIQRIQIVQVSNGIIVFDQMYGSPGVLSANITTSSLQTGTHSLRIYDGSIWATYQFIK